MGSLFNFCSDESYILHLVTQGLRGTRQETGDSGSQWDKAGDTVEGPLTHHWTQSHIQLI